MMDCVQKLSHFRDFTVEIMSKSYYLYSKVYFTVLSIGTRALRTYSPS